MARIVVCGYMIRHPLAGNIMAFFHYVLGLHRLGHDVLYLEESGWPNSCSEPSTLDYGDDPRAGIRVVGSLMADCGVTIPMCYVNRDSGEVIGAEWRDVKQRLKSADLLLNIGGVCWLPEFLLCGRRALIDMDPFFTQVGLFGAEGLQDYHVYFSYGANIGRHSCAIPTGEIDWRPTVPPVTLELWQEGPTSPDAPFTTVANWSAYGSITYQGRHYGQKDEQFLRLLDLPGRTTQRLELAVSGASDEVTKQLRSAGWLIRNAGEVSAEMRGYRAYITDSRGEFSVAKHAYVETHSGWFSDRSVCYLAAGLPTVLQDTGFSEWLSTGRGVLAFSSVEQAADALERVNAEYETHRRAAREIAERVFNATVVLPRLLDVAFASERAARRMIESAS